MMFIRACEVAFFEHNLYSKYCLKKIIKLSGYEPFLAKMTVSVIPITDSKSENVKFVLRLTNLHKDAL